MVTRTELLRARVDRATDPVERLDAALDLVIWLADADPRKALGRADRALADAETVGDPVRLARAHLARGHARLFAENPRSAFEELREARHHYVALNRPVGGAWCDLFAGIALEYLGDPGGATVRMERAVVTFGAKGELAGEARGLNSLGVGQCVIGRLDTALSLFHRASALAEKVDDPATRGLARLNAAEVRGRLGVKAIDEDRPEEAHQEFTTALAELDLLFEDAVATGFLGLEPAALAYQVVPLTRLGRTAEAVEVARRALAYAGELDLDDAIAPVLHFSGLARLADGDLDGAVVDLQRALALYGQWNLTHETVAVLRLLVEVHERRGDIPTAFAVQKLLLQQELRMRDAITEREDQMVVARFAAERELAAAEHGKRPLVQLVRENRRLADERRAMERLAHTDGLTSLANRRHFDAQFARLLVQAELTDEELSLVLVDIDHFKRINDQYSHLVGDQVLRSLAAEINRHCRASDLAARIGGEEFAVLLPGTTLAEAIVVAERLRISVAALDFSPVDPLLRVTVSAGVASSAVVGTSGRPAVEELFAAADAALYQAKRGGRNRIRGAPSAAGSSDRSALS